VVGTALAALVASAMIKTFGHGLVQTGTIIEPAVTLAILTGAIAWVLFASRTGLPVSTTHALTGAIVGTGFVAFAGEGLIWSAIGEKMPFLCCSVRSLPSSSLFIYLAVEQKK